MVHQQKYIGTVLEYEMIVVTYAYEFNMCSVSTILPPKLTEFPTKACLWSKFAKMRKILLSNPTVVDIDLKFCLQKKQYQDLQR